MPDPFTNIWGALTGDPMQNAAQTMQQAITQGYNVQAGNYADARKAITGNYANAISQFTPYTGLGFSGTQAYADASGANGPEGLARARANFDAMVKPDYNLAVDAMQRVGNAGGVALGNISNEAGKYVANTLAGQYGDYVSRLAPWLNYGTTTASDLANLYTGQGTALAGNYTGMGDAAARAFGAYGQAGAQGDMAPMVAGATDINLGLNLAKLAAGGGLPSLSSIGSGLNFLGRAASGSSLLSGASLGRG